MIANFLHDVYTLVIDAVLPQQPAQAGCWYQYRIDGYGNCGSCPGEKKKMYWHQFNCCDTPFGVECWDNYKDGSTCTYC